MSTNSSTQRTSHPKSDGVMATKISAPPGWALLQRRLIGAINTAVPMMLDKYTEAGGTPYFADAVDDLYELFYNWGLFYAMGGEQQMRTRAMQQWNAVTRFCDDGVVSRSHPRFGQQIHNEYYNDTEWHHQSEGNSFFYDLGVADPTISENVRRAKRFAAMFIGEDPEAPNYDARHNVLRSPVSTSRGPLLHGDSHFAETLLLGRPHEPFACYGTRASLFPVINELDRDWSKQPDQRDKILELFDKIVLNSDVPQNMCATALVTNAYLYTGEDKYRQWVLNYVDGWMDRMRRNDGIMPDNVGPTGKIGEHRKGQWWGGYYGWHTRWSPRIMFNGLIVGAECALLLTGDFGYLEMLRSQIQLLMDNATTGDDGQLLLPLRYGPDGWSQFEPYRILDAVHLWHASMDPSDYELIKRMRDGDKTKDWNQVESFHEKNNREGNTEYARFQYYDGQNPAWPEQIMRAELQAVMNTTEAMHADQRDVDTIIADNIEPINPVVTKGLTQMTLGSPHSIYNGGLLRATVRYFDAPARRPGLPEDIAALVDDIKSDSVGIQLVNMSMTDTRELIVQAGAFGEHKFTQLKYESNAREPERVVPIDAKHFSVRLQPSTAIRFDVGMRRFANRPSYAFPWHGSKIPVPFQS